MSVCPSVRWSVGPSVRHAFVFRPTRSDECRVYGPFTCSPLSSSETLPAGSKALPAGSGVLSAGSGETRPYTRHSSLLEGQKAKAGPTALLTERQTDGRTDQPTVGQTDPVIEMQGRI